MSRLLKVSAIWGAVIWVAIITSPIERFAPIGIVEKLFLLGPLVVVPIGMFLIALIAPGLQTKFLFKAARVLQPWAAICVVASFLTQPGTKPAVLILPWIVTCGLLMLSLVREKLANRVFEIPKLAVLAAVIYLAIGSVWLALSRLGINPMNFGEPIVLLTAVHFTFTGFTTALILAATGSRFGAGPIWRKAYCAVSVGAILSTPLIAIGFVFSPLLKVIGIAILTVSLHALAAIFLRLLSSLSNLLSRCLLVIAAVSIFSGMILAATYGLSEFMGKLVISIPQMARTHGVINAIGFCLCGALGWCHILSKGGEQQ